MHNRNVMDAPLLTVGSEVCVQFTDLEQLIEALRRKGFQIIGPTLQDSAISYGPVNKLTDLPVGWTVQQGPGSYRLERRVDEAAFGYVPGPRSLKNFLHPSEFRVFTAEKQNGAFRILPSTEPAPKQAFLGVRPCELAAMRIQDRVLIDDRFTDQVYLGRRKNSFVVAVQCSDPAETCFCTSMDSGPRADWNYDLAMTEVVEGRRHEFLVEIGSQAGVDILSQVPFSEASDELREKCAEVTEKAGNRIERRLDAKTVRELLQKNFDSPEWEQVAGRCLACGNCTMVCPTCFCVNIEDTSDITGNHAERWRKWDSCFTLGFSYIHGGCIRLSTSSRYRQWLTHKLSYWVDQFGVLGCVGCGRCIAWCPVGIDITREVQAIRAASKPPRMQGEET